MIPDLETTLSGSAPVFTVSDLPASREFYEETLGFEISFEYGNPTFFLIIDRGDCCLHLVDGAVGKKTAGQGNAYVFSSEVDLLAAEFISRGVQLKAGPESYDYGMREIALEDPDGNQLVFGTPVEDPKGS